MNADHALCTIIEAFADQHVLVVGDLILDTYIFGRVERISPEAPVPVMREDQVEDRLGGAAAVAHMVARLGARVCLAGLLGDDAAAGALRRLLAEAGINATVIPGDPARPTTVKTRYIGKAEGRHPQQVLRVDRETRQPLTEALCAQVAEQVEQEVAGADVVLVSDYGKGVCGQRLLERLLGHARSRGTPVLVDPPRGVDPLRYAGATCLTPNRREVAAATGRPAGTVSEALLAAEQMRCRAKAEAVVVTLDKDGMALAHADGRQEHFPTRPRSVYDITGAGDMVLSVLGLARAAGADYPAAITLANLAGGLVVERLGTATLERADLLRELHPAAEEGGKVCSLVELQRELAVRRAGGQRVVFTNGCFDLLHAGHVDGLRRARALGDLLVVGLNGDASVRRLKGTTRPLHPEAARADVLAALSCVDYVVVFDEDTPAELVRAVTPDVLVKGADYEGRFIAGREHVEAHGGRVVLLPLLAGYSTSGVLGRVENRE